MPPRGFMNDNQAGYVFQDGFWFDQPLGIVYRDGTIGVENEDLSKLFKREDFIRRGEPLQRACNLDPEIFVYALENPVICRIESSREVLERCTDGRIRGEICEGFELAGNVQKPRMTVSDKTTLARVSESTPLRTCRPLSRSAMPSRRP